MCGIAGYLHFDRAHRADRPLLEEMTRTLAHRGPDGEGYYVEGNVALGHRRLSIIDVDGGAQPMVGGDGNLVVVFNGEIYNYVELRRELSDLGHRFVTRSDTEVILHAYERWGTDCLQKMNGMWAFCLWDARCRRLFVSRDRLGEKPLYFARHDNTFVFGSEIKALLAYGIPPRPALECLELYLGLGYVPEPYTGFQGIHKLRAGHYLVVDAGGLRESKYWDLPAFDETDLLRSKRDVHLQFEELFRDAVAIRMRSDVPFGAFLSGGLDSASVVATMSDLSQRPIETFTIAFPHREFDERERAQSVATHFRTNHHEYTVPPEQFDDALQQVINQYDEPFGDSSAIATGYVAQRARTHVKMVLTGDGGDEVLSGYPAYQALKLTHMYRVTPGAAMIPPVLGWIGAHLTGSRRYEINRIQRACAVANLTFNDRYARKCTGPNFLWIKRLLGDMPRITLEDFVESVMSSCPYRHDFYKLMYCHIKVALPGDMLTKLDRMSMAHSLEARTPFLDYRLVEFLTGVDKSVKMAGFERKSILRATIGRRLPADVRRARKQGFVVPLREWFRTPDFSARLRTLARWKVKLDESVATTVVDRHLSGREDHGNFL